MLSSWAKAITRKEVRAALLLIGLVATIAYGPISVLGAYLLIASIFSSAPDRFMMLGWSIVGTGGFIGLISAWVRIVVPSNRFRESSLLKWLTTLGLAIGVAGPATILYFSAVYLSNPMFWLMFSVVGVGIFLIGATIGE